MQNPPERPGPPHRARTDVDSSGRLADDATHALEMYVLYESAVNRHRAVLEMTCAAHAQSAAVVEASTHARLTRERAALGRALLREAIRAQVAALKESLIPPERVLRMLRDGLNDAIRAKKVSLPSAQFDQLRHDVMQWAIADYFAAA